MNLSRPDDWRPALARHWTLLSAGEAALVQAFRLSGSGWFLGTAALLACAAA